MCFQIATLYWSHLGSLEGWKAGAVAVAHLAATSVWSSHPNPGFQPQVPCDGRHNALLYGGLDLGFLEYATSRDPPASRSRAAQGSADAEAELGEFLDETKGCGSR